MKRVVAWALFWSVAALFYISYFGREGADQAQVLRTAVPLLLVAMGTEFAVGGVLLPRYLLRGRIGSFLLYSVYVLVISLWLVLVIVVGEFMTVGYRIDAMNPATLDRAGLLVGTYVVVAVALAIRLVIHGEALRRELSSTARTLEATREPEPLESQVDRETVRLDPRDILFLESAGDYVLVNTRAGQLMTKATLGSLADALGPHGFLRVHRSFVVRPSAVEKYTASTVTVEGREIPVSRSFREAVRSTFEQR